MLNDKDFIGYEKYTLDSFEFESGEILKNVTVEFKAKGTPKYDENGVIENAIIFFHRYHGNYASLDEIYKFTGEGQPFDFNKYYIISISSLGFPQSSSPSTTNLNNRFPEYNFRDMVNFKRQFLKERFGIEHVCGLISRGIGGYEVYTWASEYPDEMDFIIVSGSSYKTNGYRYVVSRCMDSIIESSDDFHEGVYSDSLSRVMVSLNKLLYSNYFSQGTLQTLSNDEIDILMEDFVDDGLFIDIYDFKYRNDAIMTYNVEDKLGNIKAEALVISSNNDMYYNLEFDILPLNDLLENVEILIVEPNNEYASYEEFPWIEDELSSFMNRVENKKG